MLALNKPYVRAIHGEIEENYLHQGPNRRQRRMKNAPFKGNVSHISLTVSQNLKYKRHVQVDPKTGNRINHYLPLN